MANQPMGVQTLPCQLGLSSPISDREEFTASQLSVLATISTAGHPRKSFAVG